MTELTQCVYCQEENSTPYYRDGKWQLVSCNRCGLVYLNPRPNAEELALLYTREYFEEWKIQHDHAEERVKKEIELRFSSAQRIAEEFSGNCRWLDIGCGSGYLIAAAKQLGCEVQGVEISTWAADFGTQELGIPIYNGNLEGFYQENRTQQYSIISLMAYLEHSQNPLKDLRMVSDLLCERGVVVIRVPNISSFDRYWHGRKWWGWCLPFHLYHFTPLIIKNVLEAAGLQLYKMEKIFWNPILHLKNAFQHSDLRWDGPLEGRRALDDRRGNNENDPNAAQASWKSHVRGALGWLFTGRDMVVYARKTD